MINFLNVASDLCNVSELSLDEVKILIDKIVHEPPHIRVGYLTLINLGLLKFIHPNVSHVVHVFDEHVELLILHPRFEVKAACDLDMSTIHQTSITFTEHWLSLWANDEVLDVCMYATKTYDLANLCIEIEMSSDKRPNIVCSCSPYYNSEIITSDSEMYTEYLKEMHKVLDEFNIHPEIQKVIDKLNKVMQ